MSKFAETLKALQARADEAEARLKKIVTSPAPVTPRDLDAASEADDDYVQARQAYVGFLTNHIDLIIEMAEALEDIADCSRYQRAGGPCVDDLTDYQHGLDHAVETAAAVLEKLDAQGDAE